jgi:hypothetical protein
MVFLLFFRFFRLISGKKSLFVCCENYLQLGIVCSLFVVGECGWICGRGAENKRKKRKKWRKPLILKGLRFPFGFPFPFRFSVPFFSVLVVEESCL